MANNKQTELQAVIEEFKAKVEELGLQKYTMIDFVDEIGRLRSLLRLANENLMIALIVTQRRGANTNWEAFEEKLIEYSDKIKQTTPKGE